MNLNLIVIFAAIFAFRMFFGTSLFYFLYYRKFAEKLTSRKNIAARPSPEQIRYEKQMTLLSGPSDIPVFLLCAWMYHLNITKLYFNFSDYSWLYTVACVPLLLITQDLYFYLTHRFLHWGPVFRKVHFVHHKSKNSNPFSAFSVHPAEKILELLYYPLVIIVLPLNVYVLAGYVFVTSLLFITGHSGYELNLGRHTNKGLFKFASTATFHNLHHQSVHYNFSLYFSLWDKIFGTEHKDYAELLSHF